MHDMLCNLIVYRSGVLSCLWFVGWCLFGFNTPDEHPRISNSERQYLHKQIISNSFQVAHHLLSLIRLNRSIFRHTQTVHHGEISFHVYHCMVLL
jgi:hypothetical protein